MIKKLMGVLAGFGFLFILTPHVEANPISVTIASDMQSELGCSGDWDPACAITHLGYDSYDDVWQGVFNNIPAGNWQYKAALNDDWIVNYGANAQLNGSEITLSLGTSSDVKFYYDDKSHWLTDNVSSRIVVAPGDFQSELGCTGDWDPTCLRSWLQDIDGDGIYLFLTSDLPTGTYQTKAAINEAWDENYGQGGTSGGENIVFNVPFDNAPMRFKFDSSTNILTINADVATVPEPTSIALLCLGLAGLAISRRKPNS